MYKFYKINDEMTGQRSDPYFEPNEKYYIDDDGRRVENETYTEKDAKKYDRQKEIHNILYSGDNTQMYRLYDPTDIAYDYSYARLNADDGYASLAEQQDMQYWDSVNGTKKWQDHIKSVKDKYPKKH